MRNESGYCQASGFLLAVGVEASDYAVLIIALHTAIYIFNPPVRLSEGGLYRYRYVAYVLWLILPVTAAALAFSGGKTGYITANTFCYLPKRPIWYRLALAWVPRYVIFITITVLYVAIYIYVHMKFKGFGNMAAGSPSVEASNNSGPTDSVGSGKRQSVPQMAAMDSVISPPSRQPSNISAFPPEGNKVTTSAWEQFKFITMPESPPFMQPDVSKTMTPEWEKYKFITTPESQSGIRADPMDAIIWGAHGHHDGQNDDRNTSTTLTEQPPTHSESGGYDSDQMFSSDDERPLPPRNGSNPNTNKTTNTKSSNDRRAKDPLTKTRLAIQRQLRLMFVYPLVYMLLWTIPFVAHCMNYNIYYVKHPPFVINCLTTACLAIQAAVDCGLFLWREKPWQRREKDCVADRLMKMTLGRSKSWFGGRRNHDASGGAERRSSRVFKRRATKFWWDDEGKGRGGNPYPPAESDNEMIQVVSRQSTRPSMFSRKPTN